MTNNSRIPIASMPERTRPCKAVSTFFDIPVYNKIATHAKKEGMSAAQFMRWMVDHYFECKK